MQLLLTVYDMLLFGLYVMVLSAAFLVYLVKGHKNCRICGILFLIFALDHLVISLTELNPKFSLAYNNMFMMVPTWKTLVYAGSFLCMLLMLQSAAENKKRRHFSVLLSLLIVMVITMLFIPAMPNSALKSWIYFLPNQIYLFIFSIVGLMQLKKSPDSSFVWKYPQLIAILKITLVFSILIVLEDTYVIFFRDKYTAFHLSIQMRSFTEDILRILIALLSMRILLALLKTVQRKEPLSPDLQTAAAGTVPAAPETAPSAPAVSNIPKEDPLEQFAKAYFLTGREKEIFEMLLKNMSNQEISERLIISLGTAKSHTHNIFSKINVSNRREAIHLYQSFEKKEG